MKIEKYIKMLLVSMFLLIVSVVPVYASLESSKIVTGTNNLISDGTKVLTALVAGATGFVAIKDIVQWLMADDEEKTKAKKRLQRDVGIGVLGTVGVGLIAIILAYYQ